MRRFVRLLLAIVTVVYSPKAQKMVITYQDGTTAKVGLTDISSITFEEDVVLDTPEKAMQMLDGNWKVKIFEPGAEYTIGFVYDEDNGVISCKFDYIASTGEELHKTIVGCSIEKNGDDYCNGFVVKDGHTVMEYKNLSNDSFMYKYDDWDANWYLTIRAH